MLNKDSKLCACGKHYGRPKKLSKFEYCYDKKYDLPKLIEGPQRIGLYWVKKKTKVMEESETYVE